MATNNAMGRNEDSTLVYVATEDGHGFATGASTVLRAQVEGCSLGEIESFDRDVKREREYSRIELGSAQRKTSQIEQGYNNFRSSDRELRSRYNGVRYTPSRQQHPRSRPQGTRADLHQF